MGDDLYDDSDIPEDDECYTCSGRGALTHGDMYGGGDPTLQVCPKCKGTGRKSQTGGLRYYAFEATSPFTRTDAERLRAENERLRERLRALVDTRPGWCMYCGSQWGHAPDCPIVFGREALGEGNDGKDQNPLV